MTWHIPLLKSPKAESECSCRNRTCTQDRMYMCGETDVHANVGWSSGFYSWETLTNKQNLIREKIFRLREREKKKKDIAFKCTRQERKREGRVRGEGKGRGKTNTVRAYLPTKILHETYVNGVVLHVSSALIDVVNQCLRVLPFFRGRFREELLESWQRNVSTAEKGCLQQNHARDAVTSLTFDACILVISNLTDYRLMFSSVQSLDRLGRRGDTRDDSAEILFQSFLREAIVSHFGMSRDIHSLKLNIKNQAVTPSAHPASFSTRFSSFTKGSCRRRGKTTVCLCVDVSDVKLFRNLRSLCLQLKVKIMSSDYPSPHAASCVKAAMTLVSDGVWNVLFFIFINFLWVLQYLVCTELPVVFEGQRDNKICGSFQLSCTCLLQRHGALRRWFFFFFQYKK